MTKIYSGWIQRVTEAFLNASVLICSSSATVVFVSLNKQVLTEEWVSVTDTTKYSIM